MYDLFLRSRRYHQAGLGLKKLSSSARLFLLFLGVAFLIAACADDSLENMSGHQGHHRGGGHGRGQYGDSRPTPTPSSFY